MDGWGRSAYGTIFGYRFDMQMLSLQAEEELREGCARHALQLQEMGRRERLLRADLGLARQQVGRRQGWERPARWAAGSKSRGHPLGRDSLSECRRENRVPGVGLNWSSGAV